MEVVRVKKMCSRLWVSASEVNIFQVNESWLGKILYLTCSNSE